MLAAVELILLLGAVAAGWLLFSSPGAWARAFQARRRMRARRDLSR